MPKLAVLNLSEMTPRKPRPTNCLTVYFNILTYYNKLVIISSYYIYSYNS